MAVSMCYCQYILYYEVRNAKIKESNLIQRDSEFQILFALLNLVYVNRVTFDERDW